MNSNKNLI